MSCCCARCIDSDWVCLLDNSCTWLSSVVIWFVKRCISFLAFNKVSVIVLLIISKSDIFLVDSSRIFLCSSSRNLNLFVKHFAILWVLLNDSTRSDFSDSICLFFVICWLSAIVNRLLSFFKCSFSSCISWVNCVILSRWDVIDEYGFGDNFERFISIDCSDSCLRLIGIVLETSLIVYLMRKRKKLIEIHRFQFRLKLVLKKLEAVCFLCR